SFRIQSYAAQGKAVGSASDGKIVRGKICAHSGGQLSIEGQTVPLTNTIPGMGESLSDPARTAFETGVCRPMTCAYDFSSKRTTVGGTPITPPTNYNHYGLRWYQALQSGGACVPKKFSCSLAKVDGQPGVYVAVEGNPSGQGMKNWQDVAKGIRDASEQFGCEFKSVGCALGGSGSTAEIKVGAVTFPDRFPRYSGDSSSESGIESILSNLGFLEGICPQQCTYEAISANTVSVSYANGAAGRYDYDSTKNGPLPTCTAVVPKPAPAAGGAGREESPSERPE
ncbi:MAG: hypothetical protein AAB425_04115, partial [Bdellovibrionota bacterium]